MVTDFKKGKWRKGRNKKAYWSNFITFDIEATTFPDHTAMMYIWSVCFSKGEHVYGRTWESFMILLNTLIEAIDMDMYPYKNDESPALLIFVHNLAYEFQFIRTLFKIDKVFARSVRKIVYAETDHLEFRCTYILTNMSLAKLCNNTPGVVHGKMVGDLDYRKIRWPDTPITTKEMTYIANDVLGLYECMEYYLTQDSFKTLPLTSTGFVRRDYREACSRNVPHMRRYRRLQMSEDDYLMCKEAARGGIAGSTAYWTGDVLEDVDSYDKKSSYPYSMVVDYFPEHPFEPALPEMLPDYLDQCCLIDITFFNIILNDVETIPYISIGRTKELEEYKSGNGKLYKAAKARMVITELDFLCIASQYTCDNYIVHELRVGGKGKLSKAFRTTLMDWFREKEKLKNGDPYMYAKIKNKVNASFGMMLTDVVRPEIVYRNQNMIPWSVEIKDVAEALTEYYKSKNSFLSYQDGVWVTAHARYNLYQAVLACDGNCVQVDTDSVKGVDLDPELFNQLNSQIRAQCEFNDVPAFIEMNGKRTYLGVWEHDAHYDKFVTFGAKKYAYVIDNHMGVTVSGLSKKAAEYFEQREGIDSFKIGEMVPPPWSGRTTSYYNDVEEPYYVEHNGKRWLTGSSVGIVDTSYTIGVTDEWGDMIDALPDA